eukprot:sb/3463434/
MSRLKRRLKYGGWWDIGLEKKSTTGPWTGDNCDIDIDECSEGTDDCSVPLSLSLFLSLSADIDECSEGTDDCSDTCVNTPSGSYTCTCPDGFTLSTDNTTYINECEIQESRDNCLARVNRECINFDGGYNCSCKPLYEEDDAGVCYEVDECTTGTAGCEFPDLCTLLHPGYTCTCPPGQRLEDNLKNCTDIICPVPVVSNCEPWDVLCREVTFNCSGGNQTADGNHYYYNSDSDLGNGRFMVSEYDGDNVTCTLNETLLQVTCPYMVCLSRGLPIFGVFVTCPCLSNTSPISQRILLKVKEQGGEERYTVRDLANKHHFPYTTTDEWFVLGLKLTCMDPTGLTNSIETQMQLKINDPIVYVSSLEIKPKQLEVDKLDSPIMVTGKGCYTSETVVNQTLCTKTSETFTIERILTHNESFVLEGKKSLLYKKPLSAGVYNLSLLIANTEKYTEPSRKLFVTINMKGKSNWALVGVAGGSIMIFLFFILFIRLTRGRWTWGKEEKKGESVRLNTMYNHMWQQVASYHIEMENLRIYSDKKLGSGHFGVVRVLNRFEFKVRVDRIRIGPVCCRL